MYYYYYYALLYIIMYYHVLSFIIMYYATLSCILIYYHIVSCIIICGAMIGQMCRKPAGNLNRTVNFTTTTQHDKYMSNKYLEFLQWLISL